MKPTPIGRFVDTPSYEELQEEIARLRLTDEERAALHWFAHYGLPEHRAATLRSLLERLA
jgi:hypothetical protein